jgi:pyrophosphate--fructose-6-phosphate 1-phosphotransferase
MGRSASHVTLEVALQTKPTVTLISEEIAEREYSLSHIVDLIGRAIVGRAAQGVDHGVVLIPEGLIEFIPEMKRLIEELNEAMLAWDKEHAAKRNLAVPKRFLLGRISAKSAKLMASLPREFADMLLDRDEHGNLQVSKIPTEKLLVEMVTARLDKMARNPEQFFGQGRGRNRRSPEEMAHFVKREFATNTHFFGYEGRCGAPSCFDAAYTFNLGLAAGSLALAGKTGYMVAIRNLNAGGKALALPLTGLIGVERRDGRDKMVIKKALVETDSPAFRFFASCRDRWCREDCFASPGPRQLWGPTASQLPMSVALNQGYSDLTFNLGKNPKRDTDKA